MPTLIDSVSPRHLAALVHHLEQEGFSCAGALKRAGLTRKMLERGQVPIQSVLVAMQDIVKVSGRGDLGFVRGQITHLGMNHVAAQLLLNAPTLRAGLKTLAPYMPLISAVIRMQCTEVPDAFGVEWTVARPMPYEISVLALETIAVSMHRQLLFLLQTEQVRYEMRFSWPPPQHAARYRELKSPGVVFGNGGVPTARFVLPLELADRPLAMADERTLHAVSQQASQTLRELAQDRSFSDWVRQVLTSVEEDMLGLEDVARLLRVSGKTLSRYLAQEGTRFGTIAQAVRQARAQEMLTNSRSTIGEISHSLGYSTPANFVRSFKARSGLTPARYRRERTASAPHLDRPEQSEEPASNPHRAG